jgi:hypothetical protein
MSSIISRMESMHVLGRPEIWHTLSVLWGQQFEKIFIRAPVFCEQAIYTPASLTSHTNGVNGSVKQHNHAHIYDWNLHYTNSLKPSGNCMSQLS